MNADCVRWGILGAARINRAVAPLMGTLERHRLVAIASRDRSRAAAQATQWNIPHVAASYEELLARDDVDAVYVSLANSLHAAWTIRAIEAGKHVLCEKPMALTVSEMDAIVAAARRHRVRASEALMYRHHPQTARVREIVSGGALGELREVRGTFTFVLNRPDDIRWNPALGGGSLWDVGCYPVSFALMCFDREPIAVQANAEWHTSGVDLCCSGTLTFDRNRTATFDCGFNAEFRTSIEISGTEATLHVPAPFKPGEREQLRLVRDDREEQIPIAANPLYEGELDDMARQVLDGAPPEVSLQESRRTVATLARLLTSAAGRRHASP